MQLFNYSFEYIVFFLLFVPRQAVISDCLAEEDFLWKIDTDVR